MVVYAKAEFVTNTATTRIASNAVTLVLFNFLIWAPFYITLAYKIYQMQISQIVFTNYPQKFSKVVR